MTDLPIWRSQVHDQGDSRTVTISGELDLTVAGDLRQMLIAQLDRAGTTGVNAELSAVTFLDSAGLGALIGAFQHADQLGRGFTVSGPVQGVQRVMQIAGVYDLLTVGDVRRSQPG
ncbi:STAS domain-containing protein [Actinoplanes sp. NBRC 103695]|uniref:STAS domain-containing protein n=1 Tax=Actinoplanes sp. NBRC 103695 TaxID=3032202 RepID=UPI0024A30721|nr:STAS domain-containing protein [Actinoplanes sp. NBRC 103695]GLY94468.1 hypothetical protein Acsp02_17240 [Actinoplanes sp. NBRC 103695]